MIAEVNGHSVPADGGAVPVSHASPIPENGWPLRPFQIVSLWQMLFDFEAGKIAIAIRDMSRLIQGMKEVLGREGVEAVLDADPLFVREIRAQMDSLRSLVATHGFERTTEAIDELVLIHPENSRPYAKGSLIVYMDRVTRVWKCLEKDMCYYSFFSMPHNSALKYDNQTLFGAKVKAQFPRGNEQAVLAGTCYATGNYTASVFHLTRALEYGLFVLAQDKKLFAMTSPPIAIGVTDARSETWETLINKVESAVSNIQKIKGSPVKQQTLDDYSGVALHFRYFKDHWRNPVSHARASYDEPQARSAFTKVDEFMNGLADLRLRERGTRILP